MMSIWTETAEIPRFGKLQQDIHADVLVIGGGMAGILCAYMLQNAGVDCVLMEADTICSGITKNTTAKITFQHGLIYDKLLQRFGAERTRMYLEANQKALEEFRVLGKKMACDFTEKDSFVYSVENRTKLEKEIAALEKIGFQADFQEHLRLPFSVAGAVHFSRQAEFHPLKFISEIVKGLTIYEHTKVEELALHKAVTGCGTVTADKIIVATHFPFLNKYGSYFLKMYQDRSYVIALENAGDVDGMYIDEDKKGFSFRNYKELLLVGGGSHRTGKQGGNYAQLDRFSQQYYPEAVKKAQWATQDCMTLDEVPYIGPYSGRTSDMYVAAGFNKWGMTSSMAAARLLTDSVLGREHPFAPVFSPSRSVLHLQILVNAGEAVGNLFRLSEKRCPHMGCALRWNEQERSWDCPCHGSRFSEKGDLIDNPATGDLPDQKDL